MAGIDSNTKLILQGNSYGSKHWLHDYSGQNHVVTKNGDAQIDTAQKKFGDASVLLDGTGDYISIPDSDDWYFGTGDFVIDFWIRFSSGASATQTTFISQMADGTSNYWFFRKNSNDKLLFQSAIGGVVKAVYVSATAPSLSNAVWYHLAVVRVSTTIKMYINGTQHNLTESTAIGTNDLGNISAPLSIGSRRISTYDYVNGNMDEIRISKGTNRGWTGSSITVPTSAYTSDNNTKLLLHFDSVLPVKDASLEILDDSNSDTHTGHIITQVGTAQLSTTQKKFGSTSIYFDGTDDSISIPDSTDWDIFGSTTSNWTIDYWIRVPNITDTDFIFAQRESDANVYQMKIDTGTLSFKLYVDPSYRISLISDTDILANTWNHVAIIKVGSDYAMYLNGIKVATDLSNAYTATLSGDLYIGRRESHSAIFTGWIDEFRYQNSNPFNAVPTSSDSITVPTSAHTADSDTKLLLHFESQDNSAQAGNIPKIPKFNGDAQIDTAQYKFGSGSYLFDGTGDYISIPDSSDWDIFANTTDSWTVDFWVYSSTFSTAHNLLISQSEDNDKYCVETYSPVRQSC